MKKIFKDLKTCRLIIAGKTRNTRVQRRTVAGTIWAITGVIMLLSILLKGIMWSSFLYAFSSVFKHIGEALGKSSNWMNGGLTYLLGDVLKEWLIQNSSVAAFLSAAGNASWFGKIIQIVFVAIGASLFICVASWAGISADVFCKMSVELHVLKHPYGILYERKLKNFLDEFKSKEYSSDELKKDRRWKLFQEDQRAQNLLSAKLAREEREKKEREQRRRQVVYIDSYRRHG